MQARCVLVGLAAAAAGGCAMDPEIGVAYEPQPLVGEQCQTNTCGDGNSPVIDGVYFWRLHIASLPGLPNPEGVWISSVKDRNGVPLALELVGGDRLRGVTASGNIVEHTDLEGAEIGVTVRVKGKKEKHTIFIEHVAPNTGTAPDEPEEWFWVGNQRPIEAYSFYYQPLDSMDRHPLCSEGDGDPNKIQALVFGGDLYNPNDKTIKVGPETDGWINIACRDSAIYKMHKIGHTSAAVARAVVEETTVDQRRAMLNAWTSNVCGTGEAFTKQGERIKLRDSLELLPEDSPYLDPLDPEETASIEAIWGPGGAVCLDIHRLQGSPDEVEIPCKDSLSRCTDLLGDWTAHGHVLTGNPKPAP